MRRIIPCTLAAACLAALDSQAAPITNNLSFELNPPSGANDLPDELEIRLRLAKMQGPIKLGYDADIRAYLTRYLTYGSRETMATLGRGLVYLPVIEHYLAMRGLPTQLKYLPMMESALLINAVSTKSAAGLWQITPETARSLGLTVDKFLDERKDPHRSTAAAVKYLEKLRNKYGNWELALLAYNCGPGRLNKAIQQAGCTEYHQVKLYLPKETQTYLARFLATAYVGEHSHHHGLFPALPDPNLYHAVAAKVFGALSLRQVAKATGLNMATLRRLNPAFLGEALPAKPDGIFLNLPKDAWPSYLDAMQSPITRP